MHPDRTSYLPEIDGLRAVAVLLVLVFHFGVADIGHAGFIGVDIFFVISGFLITRIIVGQLDEGSFRLSRFYFNRIRRLAPALLITVSLAVAWSAMRQLPDQFTEVTRQAILSQLYLVNFHFYSNVGYFGLQAADVPLLHLWSLAVEEHFYIFFPLGLMLLYRHARRFLWWGVALVTLLSFVLNILLVSYRPELTFYMLPTRAWELLAGALAARTLFSWQPGSGLREAALLAGLGLIVLALAVHTPSTSFPGTYALLPVAAGMLVVMSAGQTPTRLSALMSSPVMRYIGRISYPLYLVHWPIHVFARDALGDSKYGLPERWAMLATSVVLAATIYHLVEEPLRSGRVFASSRRLLAAYVAGVASIGAIFLAASCTDGLPGRFPKEVQALTRFVHDKSPALRECQFTGKPLDWSAPGCRIGDPGSPVTWLVYGDSHAWAAHGAVDIWLKRAGKAGRIYYRHSCPPVLGLHVLGDGGRCLRFNRSIVEHLAREPEVSNVFLISTWIQPTERILSTEQGLDLDLGQSIAAFDAAFDRTVLDLNSMGKSIYVWEPVPGARGPVPVTLARAELAGQPADLNVPRSTYDSRFAFFFEALERNRNKIHARFSPASVLCDTQTCKAVVDGTPVYFDNSHITRSLAGHWAERMRAAGVNP